MVSPPNGRDFRLSAVETSATQPDRLYYRLLTTVFHNFRINSPAILLVKL